MDRFFKIQKCDRCGGSLEEGRQMSRFNEDCLCHACIKAERQHPDYQKAMDAEIEQLRLGNRNFPGVGWPGHNGRLK